MGRGARGIVATFDALVMVAVAFSDTGARPDAIAAHPHLWGAAAAAAVCAAVVLAELPALLAWIAIGYVVYAGLFAPGAPYWIVAALALALIPLVPRPRGSLAVGVAAAAVVAVGLPIVLGSLR